jgi:hypothetical protein
MPRIKRDLVGRRFGHLTVVEFAGVRGDNAYWMCLCDCGKTKLARRNHLLVGDTKSCGCSSHPPKHGHSFRGRHTSEYRSWRSMITRCTYPNDPEHAWYFGHVTICARWLGESGFNNFIADMGLKPSPKHTIDRYPDPAGNYEPSNCRWATPMQQRHNRRPLGKQQESASAKPIRS